MFTVTTHSVAGYNVYDVRWYYSWLRKWV